MMNGSVGQKKSSSHGFSAASKMKTAQTKSILKTSSGAVLPPPPPPPASLALTAHQTVRAVRLSISSDSSSSSSSATHSPPPSPEICVETQSVIRAACGPSGAGPGTGAGRTARAKSASLAAQYLQYLNSIKAEPDNSVVVAVGGEGAVGGVGGPARGRRIGSSGEETTSEEDDEGFSEHSAASSSSSSSVSHLHTATGSVNVRSTPPSSTASQTPPIPSPQPPSSPPTININGPGSGGGTGGGESGQGSNRPTAMSGSELGKMTIKGPSGSVRGRKHTVRNRIQSFADLFLQAVSRPLLIT